MKLAVAGAVALFAMAVFHGEGHAQTPDPHFQQFITTDFHKGLVVRALAQMPPAVFQRCPALVSNRSQVTVVKPVTFGADGYPNSGFWKETFPISGCGNDTTLNFFFVVGAEEKVNTVIGVPGGTIASPVLQNDARKYANISLATKAKDCKSFDVKTSRFEAYGLANPATPDPGADAPRRPWWETWTIIGCGRTFDVPIDFIPDATGTEIVQPVKDIVER